MNEPGSLTGTCHCGAVKLEASCPPTSVTECNCSICRRYGAKWAYYTASTAHVVCEPEAVCSYSWGDHEIEFYHCRKCGCLTHYESVDKSADYRIAINARMMSPEDIEEIPVKRFDGADTWKYLDG